MMTDETWKPEGDVLSSDRGARYDGILSFDPLWIIVIENKPLSKNIWEEQVHSSLPDGHEIDIDRTAIVLRWRNVVERLTALISGNVVHGAERMIVDDFLQFVDQNFSYLNPYDTFRQCKTSRALLERRCRNVLEEIAPGHVEWQLKWGTHFVLLRQPSSVKMCGLYPTTIEGDTIDKIQLGIYPGDSMAQAKALFAYLDREGAERLLSLTGRGWKIRPNFHFGFIRRGFGHGVNTRLSLEDYIAHWTRFPIRQLSLSKRTFEASLQDFVSIGMMESADVSKVVAELPKSAQPFNVIPGLGMSFDWSLSRAVEIDKHGLMVKEVARIANEGLSACGGGLVDLP